MGGRVTVGNGTVRGGGKNVAIRIDDHRPDRYFVQIAGLFSFGDREESSSVGLP
jgi:hypothetical protein